MHIMSGDVTGLALFFDVMVLCNTPIHECIIHLHFFAVGER